MQTAGYVRPKERGSAFTPRSFLQRIDQMRGGAVNRRRVWLCFPPDEWIMVSVKLCLVPELSHGSGRRLRSGAGQPTTRVTSATSFSPSFSRARGPFAFLPQLLKCVCDCALMMALWTFVTRG